MPDGSSPDTPVTRPGPSERQKSRIRWCKRMVLLYNDSMDPYHSQRGMIAPLVLAILLIAAAIIGARYANRTTVESSPSPSPEPAVSGSATPSPMAEASPSGSLAPNALVTEFSMAGYMNAVKTG